MQPSQENRLEKVMIAPEATIADAVRQLDEAGTGALVLCHADRKLRGLLTDGDIRRAILRNRPFTDACSTIASLEPIVASTQHKHPEILRLMNETNVNQIPVVSPDGEILTFMLRSDLVKEDDLHMSAVIMAGGYGKRLMPLTANTPKPMLPIGDRPLMQLTIERLRESGIRRVNVTTHHLSERITNHFGDGQSFGVELTYVSEDHPLGTIGGLKLLNNVTEPVLVINGDILTGVHFRNILDYHRQQGADLTVGVRKYEFQVPYGVVDNEGPYVRRIVEKPKFSYLVNAGIYMLEPSVYRFIPSGRRFDMTDLIERLLHAGRPVVSFPITEYWADIGQHADYEQVQKDVLEGRLAG